MMIFASDIKNWQERNSQWEIRNYTHEEGRPNDENKKVEELNFLSYERLS